MNFNDNKIEKNIENFLVEFIGKKEKEKILLEFHFGSCIKAKIFKRNVEEYEQKSKIYDKGMKIIEEKISYKKYLQLVTDMKNLQSLLLSREQRLLFKMMSKPILNTNFQNNLETKDIDDDITDDDDDIIFNLKALKTILQYIKSLASSSDTLSDLDKKLLDKLDPDFANLIIKELKLNI